MSKPVHWMSFEELLVEANLTSAAWEHQAQLDATLGTSPPPLLPAAALRHQEVIGELERPPAEAEHVRLDRRAD